MLPAAVENPPSEETAVSRDSRRLPNRPDVASLLVGVLRLRNRSCPFEPREVVELMVEVLMPLALCELVGPTVVGEDTSELYGSSDSSGGTIGVGGLPELTKSCSRCSG
jgi:hypothetical protein